MEELPHSSADRLLDGRDICDVSSDMETLVQDIVRDGKTDRWFRNSIAEPLLKSAATLPQKNAMIQHLERLCFGSQDFSVVFSKEWTFRDSYTNPNGWAVFSADRNPKAVVQLAYNPPSDPAESPACILKCVQGVARHPLDLGVIDRHVIFSMKPLHETGWKILLQVDHLAPTNSYWILRQKYFARKPEQDRCYTTLHLLNHAKKRVQELFAKNAQSIRRSSYA